MVFDRFDVYQCSQYAPNLIYLWHVFYNLFSYVELKRNFKLPNIIIAGSVTTSTIFSRLSSTYLNFVNSVFKISYATPILVYVRLVLIP